MHLCLYDAFRYDANHTTSFDLKRSRFSETLQFVESVVLKEALEPLGGGRSLGEEEEEVPRQKHSHQKPVVTALNRRYHHER